MLKGRGRDPRATVPVSPSLTNRQIGRAPLVKPEPDYEVVDFPSEQYVNANLKPPPPPPPRPPTGHPVDVDASCGLCGGGGARVRCAECGRRALCASCDDMYHRHPKRRHHQRQALTQAQLRDERPPLPPKGTPPVPPPRRHKICGDRMSASPRPPTPDQRRLNMSMSPHHNQTAPITNSNHFASQRPPVPQANNISAHVGSMPYLPGVANRSQVPFANHNQTSTMRQFPTWSQPRASLPGFNTQPNMMQAPHMDSWEPQENLSSQNWGRPLRRGASVMELGNPMNCGGCANCMSGTNTWRYGSCANLDHQWMGGPWPQTCCMPHAGPHNPQMHPHLHPHVLQTPQPYRRAESRVMSRAASRAGSRAASPALSVRSRASRRTKHRSPTPSLPSSDADSENGSESEQEVSKDNDQEDSLGPPPPPPSATWQCEHCTFVNEAGVRVCAVCCRTPTVKPIIITTNAIKKDMDNLKLSGTSTSSLEKKVKEQPRIRNDVKDIKSRSSVKRTSKESGPSPPKDDVMAQTSKHRLSTPTKQEDQSRSENTRIRHEIGVGPSPPKELKAVPVITKTNNSSSQAQNMQDNSYKQNKSVGPSPPRENSIRKQTSSAAVGSSPPREITESRPVSRSSRTNVSNTGTSPPPQSISTQTYEVPNNWERTSSVSRTRQRRRFRDDNQRERSHSRLSLSSDTRESERSAHTTSGRWEWREPRDSSPSGDWSEGDGKQSRLTRRASHLDVRRTRSTRRPKMFGSEAPSPEPLSNNRAISLEAIAGAASRKEAERGLELAQLMSEAEKLGFSAAEVQAALAQNPAAPLSWLKERWPSLCAGVRAAAARLAPGANVSELEARASLARNRGAMWPAVTECVERCRRQADLIGVSEERKLRGHVWGSPSGADDDATPDFSSGPRRYRAEDSSDEYAESSNKLQDDDWMYLPLDINLDNVTDTNKYLKSENEYRNNVKNLPEDTSHLVFAQNEISYNNKINYIPQQKQPKSDSDIKIGLSNKIQSIDFGFGQSESEFIDAYNSLSRLAPITHLSNVTNNVEIISNGESHEKPFKNEPPLLTNEIIMSEIISHEKGTEIFSTTSPNLLVKPNKESIENTTKKVETQSVKPKERFQTQTNVLIEPSPVNLKINLSPKKGNKPTKVHPENRPNANHFDTSNNNFNEIVDNAQKRNETSNNNFSEIVDSTQKLIQQMKNEINIDINSMNNRTRPQNNADYSSGESHLSSEQESSYSASDNYSEQNVSSDEKEITSSEEDNEVLHTQSKVIIKQTSSEDNDQFEEALDHLDNELDDMQKSNIEILDSIAKSLKEEHTLTVEYNNTNRLNPKRQDVNNNMYNVVNSFDEIYDQINNELESFNLVNKETLNNENIKLFTEPPNEIEVTKSSNYTKHTIHRSFVKIESPKKVIICDNKYPRSIGVVKVMDLPSLEHARQIEINDKPEHINTVVIHPPDKDTNLNSNYSINISQILTNVNDENSVDVDKHIMSQQVNEIDLGDKNINVPSENMLKSNEDNKTSKIEKSTPTEETNHSKNITLSMLSNRAPNFSLHKSNIPKLVKSLQSNKQKSDKIVSKIIASKVPIRKMSIKLHPAPHPPKIGHFGNVHSGNVKQLQSRLFDAKVKNNTELKQTELNIVPSTSTLQKKRQAPLPPLQQNVQIDLNDGAKKEPKKNDFFRETCRTEDEWTESESEDENNIELNIKESSSDETTHQPTPQPPITVRRVSGQLIDLANIRLSEGSPERQARMLLAEGASETWEQAQIAVKLISQGIDPPHALLAALECSDFSSALVYLQQDCELCATKYPEHEMVSLLRCTHRCCRECARHYFTVQITERNVADCVCPYCKEPELENLPEEEWLDYFANMDILLKTLLEKEQHELFQRKLRDRTLARDPNFRWCVECSSGFFVHPKQKKVRCPECKSSSCATCRKPWTANHKGITCEEYSTWLEDNDPERSIAAVQQHLRENGLECPRCRFKYSLSRGGCMHFTCTQCKYEFCYGCGKPFMMGARCGLSEYCAKLGLHAHHPRNCLFYLRDKEPHELQTLLQMNNVTYETEVADNSSKRCPIQLQRETPTGLVDTVCGSEFLPNSAGLCKMHYVEYLAGLARTLDPIPIMEVSELVAELRRRALPLPERGPWDTDPIYAGMCAEIVKEKIPLD